MDDKTVGDFWDQNAPDWIEAVREGWDVYRDYVNNPAFLKLLGNISNKRVLDLGCGEGYNTRIFADLGATVVGVDISNLLIAAARDEESQNPKGITYHVASGSELDTWQDEFGPEPFDMVLSTMVMMDLPDYATCVKQVAKLLKPGGIFQFSICHPCTMTRKWQWVLNDEDRREGVVVGDYFPKSRKNRHEDIDEWYFGAAPAHVRREVRPFQIPRFFRTLSDYFNTLSDNDFIVDRLEEPYASDDVIAKCPNVADTQLVPYFLMFRCILDHKSPAETG